VFGGRSGLGVVKGDVFCCEMDPQNIRELKRSYEKVMAEILLISNNISKKDSKQTLKF